jgi:hypothetical protein
MKKVIIIGLVLLNLSILKSQIIYKNNIIQISANFVTLDSSICLRIKNISSFILIFKQNNFRIKQTEEDLYYNTDMSFKRKTIDYVGSEYNGEFLELKQLYPNYTYNIILDKANMVNLNALELHICFDFITTPKRCKTRDLLMRTSIPYFKFIKHIKKSKLDLYHFEGDLKMNYHSINDCYKSFMLNYVRLYIDENGSVP